MKKGLVIYLEKDELHLFSFQRGKGSTGMVTLPFGDEGEKASAWKMVLGAKLDVIEIQDLDAPALRSFTLPAKDRDQLEAMVEQQAKLMGTKKGKVLQEIIPVQSHEEHHLAALLVRFEGGEKTLFKEGQFKVKNWLGISTSMALMVSHLEERKSQDLDVLHIRESLLYHMMIRKGELVEARITLIAKDMDDPEWLSLYLEDRYKVLNFSPPSMVSIYGDESVKTPVTFQLSGEVVEVRKENLSRKNETEWLMKSTAQALEGDRARPRVIFGKRVSGNSGARGGFWTTPTLLGLLLLLTLWITGYMRLEAFRGYSSDLYDELKGYHHRTLEPGKRRHFTEISFIKRIRKEAESGGKENQDNVLFKDFMSTLQETLQRCPKFICQRVQGQPQGGSYKVQGVVDNVRSFDALSQEFSKNSDWSVKANFTRSSGKVKGLKVNLSIEVNP